MEGRDFFDRFISSLKNEKSKYDLDNIHDAFILWFGINKLSLDTDDIIDHIVEDNCLNIFYDFLIDKNFKIDKNKRDILKIIEYIKKDKKIIRVCYDSIIKTLAEYIKQLKKYPDYYHNKFFKNEKSIALVRNYFNSKYKFVGILK